MIYFGNGMIESMLEPHITDDAHGTQTEVGVTFLLFGASFMVSCLIVGPVSHL